MTSGWDNHIADMTTAPPSSTDPEQRRAMVLKNPALNGLSRITQSLDAGLQLILSGEVASSHRHTQSALRFVVKGQSAHRCCWRTRL